MESYYAGIGSRSIPASIFAIMTNIGYYLARRGYTLRSGGASGSDTAFETGCDLANGKKEIYLPWKNFNNNPSPLYSIDELALKLAAEYHPAFEKLNKKEILLIARNGYQILGLDFKTPVKFIVCWTPKAQIVGGTGQALRIAMDKKIPVLNLADKNDLVRVNQWMTLNLDFLEDIHYNLFDE